MNFSDRFTQLFRFLIPNPFTIAVLLTVVTFFLAFFLTKPESASSLAYGISLLDFWEQGLWGKDFLEFEVQMMLMLVLGHSLALTKPVGGFIERALTYCHDTKSAVVWISLLTMMIALFNWGLGLVFGAVFVRKFAEKASLTGKAINYGLVGAAGYSGMMVWHGGFSGSSLVKVAEEGHLHALMQGIYSEEKLATLPSSISLAETLFSPMNMMVSIVLLCIVPLFFYFLAKNTKEELVDIKGMEDELTDESKPIGAEHLDRSMLVGYTFSLFILAYLVFRLFRNGQLDMGVINPNYINLTLLGLAILFHGKFLSFLKSINVAVLGVSGILIQFPLYFGIMGMMKGSGLVHDFSAFFVQISSETTFPIFTFISAGLVNIFMPSGGGQWMVQGPVLIQAAQELGISLQKCILALAYGDQLTNMLQPFWALPLLGITKLSAKQIIPYAFMLMLLGGLVFVLAILVF
jgi:short-chain fatty acids transporter